MRAEAGMLVSVVLESHHVASVVLRRADSQDAWWYTKNLGQWP
jgi:hypothetical protein